MLLQTPRINWGLKRNKKQPFSFLTSYKGFCS